MPEIQPWVPESAEKFYKDLQAEKPQGGFWDTRDRRNRQGFIECLYSAMCTSALQNAWMNRAGFTGGSIS